MKLKNGYTGAPSPEETQRERDHRAVARRAAAQGIVLLENDGVLPLARGTRVALYGAAARHTVMGGTGSGMVNCRAGVSVDEGLKNAGLTVTSGEWLDDLDRTYAEEYEKWKAGIYAMSIPGDHASLYRSHAANPMPSPSGRPIQREADTDIAVYVISRISGEGADRHVREGDYLLSEVEKRQLSEICAAYRKCVVVLNIGGVIDLSFLEEYPISALVLLSQAGMEGGNALGDVVTGAVTPSGRLTETWAMRYEDYPCADTFSYMNGNLVEEKYSEGIYVGYRWFDARGIAPRYPFGYGLSYTTFAESFRCVRTEGTCVEVSVDVMNTGGRPGRDVVFAFASCPDGIRQKEPKRLIGFAKTKELAPGESQALSIRADISLLASYHAGRSRWFLDAGVYAICVAGNASRVHPAAVLTLSETVWGEPSHRICPLHDALKEFSPAPRPAENAEGLPAIPMDAEAKAAMEAYTKRPDMPETRDPLTERLTLQEKACLVCGRPKSGEASFIGDAAVHVPGAAAETTSLLEKYGVPPTVLADGPAGLRLSQRYDVDPATGEPYSLSRYEALENRIFQKEFLHEGAPLFYQFCTAVPVGTCLAQSFDVALAEEIARVIAAEMEEFGVTWWLAPGMNIKRNPLCGRNFEYYSEDPLAAGKMAAAVTRGVQGTPGAAVTIKHFACNNQEDNRRGVSAVVSERALREIYLKGFEIAVREAQPWAIMTSYNKINGEHTANSHDLCTLAAREEWGFRGIVMTDWTTTNSDGGSSAAKCVAAGNDLIMPGLESDIREITDALKGEGEQSLDERDLDACCSRILNAIRQLCL